MSAQPSCPASMLPVRAAVTEPVPTLEGILDGLSVYMPTYCEDAVYAIRIFSGYSRTAGATSLYFDNLREAASEVYRQARRSSVDNFYITMNPGVPDLQAKAQREFDKGVAVREGPAAKTAARWTINNLRRCDPPSLPHEVVANAAAETFQTPSEQPMPFDKYRGLLISELPDSYLRWLHDRSIWLLKLVEAEYAVTTRITMLALQWQKANGKNTYETLIEFATNHHWDEFQRQALIAISTLLEGEGDKR